MGREVSVSNGDGSCEVQRMGCSGARSAVAGQVLVLALMRLYLRQQIPESGYRHSCT